MKRHTDIDYSELTSLKHDLECKVDVAYETGYDSGYDAGFDDALTTSKTYYTRGLEDAWKIAKAIATEFTISELRNAGLIIEASSDNEYDEYEYSCRVFNKYSVHEIKDKLEKYTALRNKSEYIINDVAFNAGDVVYLSDNSDLSLIVITRIYEDDHMILFDAINSTGRTYNRLQLSDYTRTGTHYDDIEYLQQVLYRIKLQK